MFELPKQWRRPNRFRPGPVLTRRQARPPARQRTASPRLVVLSVGQQDRLAATATAVGLTLTDAPGLARAVSRPCIIVDSGEIAGCLLGSTDDAQPIQVRLIAGAAGMVAVAPDSILESVRRLADATLDPMHAVGEILVLLASTWEEAQEDLVDGATDLSESLGGLRSAQPRRQIAQLRARLMTSRHRMAAQARMLEPGSEFFDMLPVGPQRRVDRARNTFLDASATAAQTYQMLGDVLTLQATTISERLTLTSVLFLPLTVITGFFGMNFGWLVDAIAGAPAFWALGVAFPVVVVLIIVRLVRSIGDAEL